MQSKFECFDLVDESIQPFRFKVPTLTKYKDLKIFFRRIVYEETKDCFMIYTACSVRQIVSVHVNSKCTGILVVGYI